MTATFPIDTLPNFKNINPEKIESDVRSILESNRKKLAQLLAQPQPFTWENLMQPLEDMDDTLSKVWSPVQHLHNVMQNEALRKAYNATLPLLTEYHTELSQNENLYKAIASLAESADFAKLNAAQRKIIEHNLRDYKLAGIHLPADKKARVAALELELSQLTTKFSENLLDATNAWTLHLTEAHQLDGLPPQAFQLSEDSAKQRHLDGYVLTLEYPSYSSAIQYLKNRELRKQVYEAYTTRASEMGPHAGKWDNTAVMDNILRVRHEIAQLVGYSNFADYSLAPKMAKTPEDVLHFLSDLLERSKPLAQKEISEVAALAKKLDGIEKLETWDLPYYSEKLQESKFLFTQEELRPYFPIDKVLAGLFQLVQILFGIAVREEKNIPVWHPDVRFFSLHDENSELRAGFYVDLYARPNKNSGAWMDDCLDRRMAHGHLQLPVAYLNCNFMPPVGNQPALLTHDDVLTLFHEFGHCLHHMLTKVDYAGVSGIHGVAWDAVEFPSQFMENFCWEKETLDMIAAHYQTSAPLPNELFNKMLAAKHFQTGMQMVRQLEFALFDFRLHHEFQPNQQFQPQAMLNEVRKQTALLNIPTFNRFQNSFSHIFSGGYAAGYYSYKWAEVLSADAYAQFEEHGILDKATGRSFMHNILEVGGSREPMDSFVAFRGREPKIDALLRHSGIA